MIGPHWKEQKKGTGKATVLPYPEMDSGDVGVAESSDGLLSSLLVGGGWDMPDAGAGGKGAEASGAAAGEASGGAGVPWPALACDSKKGVRQQHPYQASTPCPTTAPPCLRLISPGHTRSLPASQLIYPPWSP